MSTQPGASNGITTGGGRWRRPLAGFTGAVLATAGIALVLTGTAGAASTTTAVAASNGIVAPGAFGYIAGGSTDTDANGDVLLDITLQQSTQPSEPEVGGDTILFIFAPDSGSGFWKSSTTIFQAQEYSNVVLAPQSATGSGTESGTLKLLDVSRSDIIDQSLATVTFGSPSPTPTTTSPTPSPTTSSPTPTPTTTSPSNTKQIEAKALSDHDCDSSEWHFVITQVDNQADAPTSIHVTWANGNEADVALGNFTGGVAHYTTTANLGSTVTSATAQIYADWSGEFNLSHGPCASQSPSPSPTTTSPTPSPTTSSPTPTPTTTTVSPTPTSTTTSPSPTPTVTTTTPVPTTTSPVPTPTSTSPAPQQVSFVLTATRECTHPCNAHLSGHGSGAPNGEYYLTVAGKVFTVTADVNGNLSFSGILSLSTKAAVTLSWRLDSNMSNLGQVSGTVTIPAASNCSPSPAPSTPPATVPPTHGGTTPPGGPKSVTDFNPPNSGGASSGRILGGLLLILSGGIVGLMAMRKPARVRA